LIGQLRSFKEHPIEALVAREIRLCDDQILADIKARSADPALAERRYRAWEATAADESWAEQFESAFVAYHETYSGNRSKSSLEEADAAIFRRLGEIQGRRFAEVLSRMRDEVHVESRDGSSHLHEEVVSALTLDREELARKFEKNRRLADQVLEQAGFLERAYDRHTRTVAYLRQLLDSHGIEYEVEPEEDPPSYTDSND
jgi:hypothetical protein